RRLRRRADGARCMAGADPGGADGGRRAPRAREQTRGAVRTAGLSRVSGRRSFGREVRRDGPAGAGAVCGRPARRGSSALRAPGGGTSRPRLRGQPGRPQPERDDRRRFRCGGTGDSPSRRRARLPGSPRTGRAARLSAAAVHARVRCCARRFRSRRRTRRRIGVGGRGRGEAGGARPLSARHRRSPDEERGALRHRGRSDRRGGRRRRAPACDRPFAPRRQYAARGDEQGDASRSEARRGARRRGGDRRAGGGEAVIAVIVLADPDPSWRILFEEERARLAAALEVPAAAVEHVGSTAVASLPAKPVIDVVVGLEAGADAEALAGSLARLGYERRPDGEFPGRIFLVRQARGSEPRWHLSLCERGGACWRDQLAFRDALRREPELASRYAALKRELVAQRVDDRLGYARAKASFVRDAHAASGEASEAGRPLEGRQLWFAGIGGAGMSALAIVARDWGARVAGWDRVRTRYLDPLDGVEVEIAGDPPEPPPGWESIDSTAFAGRVDGRRRGELLAELVSLRPSIVVAGAHGKTTAAAMIAFCLDRLGLDPTFLVGGPVPQRGANARAGDGWLVAEGDESDRSLELLRPEIG